MDTYSLVSRVDTIHNILRLTVHEKFYRYELSENDRPIQLCSDHNSEAIIKTLVNEATQPIGLLFDLFSGSCSMAQVCMLLAAS